MTTLNTQCRELAERREPPLEPDVGEFVVEVDHVSIGPAMRTWMNAGRSDGPPVEIDEVMRALAVGHVIESRHPGFASGDGFPGCSGCSATPCPTEAA
jgi:hypothetical protein